MDSGQGWVQLRRELREHMRDGRLNAAQAGVYSFLLMDAEPDSGVWVGDAAKLQWCFGGSMTERQARGLLEFLEDSHYISRFSIPGSRRAYPVLIHQYPVTVGARSGRALNAHVSKSDQFFARWKRDLTAWKSSGYEGLVWEWPPGRGEVDASSAPGRGEVVATPLHPPKAKARENGELITEKTSNTKTGPQTARTVQPPCGKVKNEGQKQYAQVRELADCAEKMLTTEPHIDMPSLIEDLKRIAAAHSIPCYGEKVRRAADIATRRHTGTPIFNRNHR